MKRLLALIMALTMLLSSGVLAAVSFPLSVYVDGQRVQFPDATPFIDGNNRTMVPVRFVSEALNAEVGWDGALRQVTVTKDSKKIVLTINKPEMQINGVTKVLDCAPLIVDDRTFVPIRFVSEALDAVVEWDGAVRTVYISTKKKEEEKKQEKKVSEVTGNGLKVEVMEGDRFVDKNDYKVINKESGLSIQYNVSDQTLVNCNFFKGSTDNVEQAKKEAIDIVKQLFSAETVEKVKSYLDENMESGKFADALYLEEGNYDIYIGSTSSSVRLDISKL